MLQCSFIPRGLVDRHPKALVFQVRDLRGQSLPPVLFGGAELHLGMSQRPYLAVKAKVEPCFSLGSQDPPVWLPAPTAVPILHFRKIGRAPRTTSCRSDRDRHDAPSRTTGPPNEIATSWRLLDRRRGAHQVWVVPTPAFARRSGRPGLTTSPNRVKRASAPHSSACLRLRPRCHRIAAQRRGEAPRPRREQPLELRHPQTRHFPTTVGRPACRPTTPTTR